MIRTREQRQADRDWCSQFMESDDLEDCGHGVVLGVAVGIGVWLVVMMVIGWL